MGKDGGHCAGGVGVGVVFVSVDGGAGVSVDVLERVLGPGEAGLVDEGAWAGGAHGVACAACSATRLETARPNTPTVWTRALLSSAQSVRPFVPTSSRPWRPRTVKAAECRPRAARRARSLMPTRTPSGPRAPRAEVWTSLTRAPGPQTTVTPRLGATDPGVSDCPRRTAPRPDQLSVAGAAAAFAANASTNAHAAAAAIPCPKRVPAIRPRYERTPAPSHPRVSVMTAQSRSRSIRPGRPSTTGRHSSPGSGSSAPGKISAATSTEPPRMYEIARSLTSTGS